MKSSLGSVATTAAIPLASFPAVAASDGAAWTGKVDLSERRQLRGNALVGSKFGCDFSLARAAYAGFLI